MFRASYISSEETLPVISSIPHSTTSTDPCPTNSLLRNASATQNGNSRYRHSQEYTLYGLSGVSLLEKYKYPIAVVFVLATKFFEAFAANGIRTILVLYLRDDLYFSEVFSTVMLHIFNFFGQFCPIFGAILADSYLGNIRTISSFCCLYGFGWILLILTSVPNIGISLVFLVSISLMFIAIGNGSVRACITSLGALQFKVPEQNISLIEYFSWYYFVYYAGIFLSKILPPLVRSKTQCFNKSDCYPAVFGTLGVSFFASWLTFCIGKFFYKPDKLSEENVLIKFYGCVKYALAQKWCARKTVYNKNKNTYWLYRAVGRYDEAFVNDVAKVLKITKLFIPLPFYFALLVQQDSTWTFQASQMNTTIIGVYTIQADQAKAMGPIFLFILIPFWQYIVHPLIKRIFKNEIQPLHSVAIGGTFSVLSFICAGLLQEYISVHPYKSVSVFWQIPQFILLMLGEVLLSIPGLQFAFTQAPDSMKSVVTAAWFLNNAFGNLIVIIITEFDIFSSQTTGYLFYAMIMLLATIIFTILANSYVQEEKLVSNNDLTNVTSEVSSLNGNDEIPSTSGTYNS